MQPEAAARWAKTNVWGLFLLVLGLWWLLAELSLVPFDWGVAGPLALLATGAGMILGRRRRACD